MEARGLTHGASGGVPRFASFLLPRPCWNCIITHRDGHHACPWQRFRVCWANARWDLREHAGRKMSNSREAGVSETSPSSLTHLNSAVFPAGAGSLTWRCLSGVSGDIPAILTPFMRLGYWSSDSRLYMHVLSPFSCVRLFATPWTAARWAPLSMGFSRQEDWSGLLFPSPGDLPDPGTEPRSPALQADSLPSEPPGKPLARGKKSRIANTQLKEKEKMGSWTPPDFKTYYSNKL